MANAYRSEVNQRLYYSRLHINSLEDLLGEQQVAKTVLEQAFSESVLTHLVRAYRTYLSEIALAYSVDTVSLESAKELLKALSDGGHESAEAKELIALEDPNQWLGEMIELFHSIGSNSPRVKQQLPRQVIASASGSESTLSTLLGLSVYYEKLSELIDNQRTRLEEW